MSSDQGSGVIQTGSNSTALGLAFFLVVLILSVLVLGAIIYLKTNGF